MPSRQLFPSFAPLNSSSSGGTTTLEYAKLSDTKPSGTPGGSFTANVEITRNLNTVDVLQPWVSLANNEFTLQPGKYSFSALLPNYYGNFHKNWLKNITNNSIAIVGTSNYAASTSGDQCQVFGYIKGMIEITTQTTFDIRFVSKNTYTAYGDGLGVQTTLSGQPEVYTIVELFKLDTIVSNSGNIDLLAMEVFS